MLSRSSESYTPECRQRPEDRRRLCWRERGPPVHAVVFRCAAAPSPERMGALSCSTAEGADPPALALPDVEFDLLQRGPLTEVTGPSAGTLTRLDCAVTRKLIG
jgi:hypothetical protein